MAEIVVKRLQIATQINNNAQDDSIVLVGGRLVDDVARTVQTAAGEETNHISVETTIRPKPGTISDKFILDFLKPRVSGGTNWVGRSERRSENALINAPTELFFAISFYIPNTVADDPIGEINFQWHAGISGSSPTIAIGTENGHFQFKMQWGLSGASTNYIRLHLAPATRNTWHHFIIRYLFSNDIAIGRATVWKDGIIARCYNPLTGLPWVVPIAAGGGIPNEFIAYPVKGNLVRHLDANGEPVSRSLATVSVLDWEGRTSYADQSQKYVKWGFYKSDWADYYNSSGVPLNLNNPAGSWYIPPANRLKTIFISNMGFAVGQEADYLKYAALDVNGQDPLEFPDWFEKRPIDQTPPSSALPFPAPPSRKYRVKIIRPIL
jgi:hypothetical protein